MTNHIHLLLEPAGDGGNLANFIKHHLTGSQDAVGNIVSATYYANGLKNTATDGRNTITTLTYDSYGNPSTATTGSHPAVTYVYDGIGRMTQLTDQVGSSTSFVYDKRNLLTSKTDPLNQTSTFTYDNAGRLTGKTDRKGQTITYAYTPTDKPATITYPNSTTVSFTYNSLDNLTSLQDSTGTTGYTYDAANRLTSVTDTRNFTVSYQYDAAGNITQMNYPGGKTVSYTYDSLNRLHTVIFNGLTATYTYDAAGRLTGLSNFNGTATSYGYDNANRLTSLQNNTSGGVIAAYSFTLDGNGNRTDGVRNEPLASSLGAGTTSYAYNAKKNRLMNAGGNDFGYDNEGQLNSGYGLNYTFDYEHRLTAIDTSTQFTYDGSSNRIQAVRNGVTTRYIYDAAGNLLAEADGSNNITRYYIYGKGLLAMATPADQTYCYHFNATGSTIAMTDSSQAMVNKYAYDPFGNVLSQQEAVTNPFKYVGQFGVMTEPNGFTYMRARYYDPQVGRFISEDPIGFEGGDVNLMAYVANNPVMGVDPSGKAAFWYHFYDGVMYGLSKGNGLWYSLKCGWATMMFDFNGDKTDDLVHATSSERGNEKAAVMASYAEANKDLNSGNMIDQLRGVHTMRDIRTHEGVYFAGYDNASAVISHVVKYDLMPGDSLVNVISRAQGTAQGTKGK